ncbi:pseudouridine-5'-phosphatase [Anabrus simplex]|uniref:pseudouridine-5'-phosphatase n=1 Tax=Anabrus simplex TaxID=316456 RepID=UPI0034DDC2F8
MAVYKPVSHVVFDMDGLLIDSEQLYYKATKEVCGLFNKEYTWDMKVHTMGWLGDAASQYIVETLELPITPEKFYKELKKRYATLFPSVQLMPGAERILRHLHQHKIPIALGTSSSQENVELKLKNHKELFSLFHHMVVGSDPDVKNGKPAPDVFLVCAARFPERPAPEKVLVFEDAVNGVQAALAAGMQVVMVPSSHIPEENCRSATLVIKSLTEIKPELFGLPAF